MLPLYSFSEMVWLVLVIQFGPNNLSRIGFVFVKIVTTTHLEFSSYLIISGNNKTSVSAPPTACLSIYTYFYFAIRSTCFFYLYSINWIFKINSWTVRFIITCVEFACNEFGIGFLSKDTIHSWAAWW